MEQNCVEAPWFVVYFCHIIDNYRDLNIHSNSDSLIGNLDNVWIIVILDVYKNMKLLHVINH